MVYNIYWYGRLKKIIIKGRKTMNLSEKNVKSILGIITFGILLFAVTQHLSAVGTFISAIFKIIAPLIVGLCIAFILNIIMTVLETKVWSFMGRSKKTFVRKMLRPVSLISTIILMFGFIILLLFIIIPALKDSIDLLVAKVPGYYESIVGWIDSLVKKFELDISTDALHNPKFTINDIAAMAEKVFTFEATDNIVNTTVGVTSSVISGITNFVLGFIISTYILAVKEKIGGFTRRVLDAALPEKVTEKIYNVSRVAASSFSNFITGQFTDALLLGVLCFVGCSILRIPNAAVVAVIIGISAIIPVIGPIVGEVISVLILLMESPIKALIFLAFILILQAIDNNFIYPRIVGKSVGLPGILVFIAVVLGGNLGGIMGVLLGVPTASAVYALVTEWVRVKNEKKRLEKKTVSAEEVAEPVGK